MKAQEVRIAEAINLRAQWDKQVQLPFPIELIDPMNAFVRTGTCASGSVDFLGRALEYCFTSLEDTETYIRLKAP